MKYTEVWKQYQEGVDFKNKIDLYETVNENWRFFYGDQWHGVNAPNLPKPCFNDIKYMCRFMAVQIKDRKLAINYVTDGEREDIKAFLNQMNDYAKRTWNRLEMESKNLDGLIEAFNTGNYLLYHWWNEEIETGQPFKGDIDNMILDSVNYYPGNPNDPQIQSQPYIIIVMRTLVERAREEARKNGVSAEQAKLITEDDETEYQAGDMGKQELDKSGKCNVLLKIWKKDGEVYFSKHTRLVDIMKPTRAGLRLYPVSKMDWQPQKNCAFGVAETTYLKFNQVYINKQFAYNQSYILQAAFPKVLFNKAMIPGGWSNKLAEAIPVNGNVNVSEVAQYMQPPQLPADTWIGIDKTLEHTNTLSGVNDAAMGNITNPNNKGAFIAVREAAIVPLQSQQTRFHQFVRDTGLIWLDFFINHYPPERLIPVGDVNVPNDIQSYADLPYDTQIEVGESQMWSELNTVQTLDNLLMQQKIKFSDYLKRMPNGYIPDKEELLQQALKDEEMMMQMQAMNQNMGGVQ